MTPLPKTLQAYVDHMARENRPLEFPEIVVAYDNLTKSVNNFRFLKQRGLIENVTVFYTGAPDEVYDGPRISKYVLTELGKSYVTKP